MPPDSRHPLRIAFLTWRDRGHPDGGGSEVYVESVARELAARGHEVEVHCARYPGSRARETVDGVVLVRRGGRLTVYVRAWWWTLTAGRRTDLVVDVINGLPFLSCLARRRGVVALVHHVHREQWRIIYPGWRGRVGWWVEGWLTPRLYRGIDHVTVSRSTREDLVDLGVDRTKIRIAHNGLTPRPAADGDHRADRVSVLARLVPHKRIEHAFAVVAALRDSHPGLVLDVVGDGWWHDELVASARALGVSDRVVFHGWVPDDRRDEILASSALMILPSVKEGWGIAVMEAAAQGTPTIAYRAAGGVNESIVDGETGILVERREQLTDTVRRLLADRDELRRLSEGARRRSHVFTWAAAADVFEDLLEGAAQLP